LSGVEKKLTEIEENVGKKNFSQCHSTLNFWLQVPESEHSEFEIPVGNSILCIEQHIPVNFFPCNEVRKIKPPCNPEKRTLGRINSHSFNNILTYCPGFRGLENQTKTSY